MFNLHDIFVILVFAAILVAAILYRVSTEQTTLDKEWKSKTPPKLRSRNGEDVTEAELAMLLRNRCPDCFQNKWLPGPEGGMSKNWKCANPDCGSKFNLGPLPGMTERISDPSPLKSNQEAPSCLS